MPTIENCHRPSPCKIHMVWIQRQKLLLVDQPSEESTASRHSMNIPEAPFGKMFFLKNHKHYNIPTNQTDTLLATNHVNHRSHSIWIYSNISIDITHKKNLPKKNLRQQFHQIISSTVPCTTEQHQYMYIALTQKGRFHINVRMFRLWYSFRLLVCIRQCGRHHRCWCEPSSVLKWFHSTTGGDVVARGPLASHKSSLFQKSTRYR